jgi:hypothetical protein
MVTAIILIVILVSGAVVGSTLITGILAFLKATITWGIVFGDKKDAVKER